MKNLISVLFSLLLVASVSNATTGDMNGDGKIGLEESIISLQVAAGSDPVISSTGYAGIVVFDANDQLLGILMSMVLPAFGDSTGSPYFTVFNPQLELVIAISKVSGELLEPDNRMRAYFMNTSRCDGQPSYATGYGTAYSGFLLANTHSSVTTHPYITFGRQLVEVTSVNWSISNLDGSSSCSDDYSTTFSAHPVNYLTAPDVSLEFPITFPLRYETGN